MTGTREDFSGDCRGNDMYWTDREMKDGILDHECNDAEVIVEETEAQYLQDYVLQII